MMLPQKVIFVCTGNICRSPTADGVLRHRLLEDGRFSSIPVDAFVDSAGTHAYHVGEAPDPRTQKVALSGGVDLSFLRARQLVQADYQPGHLLLAMDAGHLQHMRAMAPDGHQAELALFLDYAGLGPLDVPDPYYGSHRDFMHVLQLVQDGVEGLLGRFFEQAG